MAEQDWLGMLDEKIRFLLYGTLAETQTCMHSTSWIGLRVMVNDLQCLVFGETETSSKTFCPSLQQ